MRPESLYFLFSPITRLKGIGGATAQALQRLLPAATMREGNTMPIVRDLLFHLPVGLVDRRFTSALSSAPEGVVATFIVTVESHQPPPIGRRGGKRPYRILCSNETGDITLVFFHAREDYLKSVLPVGARRVISGKTEYFDFRLQMTHPDIIAPVDRLAEVQRPEPVYPLTVGLTSRRIGKIVDDALAKLPELPEWQAVDGQENPSSSVIRHPLTASSWKSALYIAHHPESQDELSPRAPARMRLAYDEVLANQLYIGRLRRHMQRQAGEVITGTGALTQAFMASLPFTLTQGQHQVLQDIYRDIASGHRMGRLLQGDVGSGKTVVALLAMLRAAEQGLQSALMVPTEIVARQHYEVISKMVDNISSLPIKEGRLKVVLLTGTVKGAERESVLAAIASGEAQIVIGTHALFQEQVVFKNLALAVIDEQHRFGVNQRMALSAKGNAPHLLHMTATPIPRSLAMTLYGDMESSMLTEKPAERQPVTTRVIPQSRYEEVMQRLKAALDKGEKAYWICPLIEESWDVAGDTRHDTTLPRGTFHDDLAAVRTRHKEFTARFGPVAGLVHGRMKATEREAHMQDFASGKTRLLVATTVVEVGVDVRDATIMVIEQAERFGLSQLHQLRGRVGRGSKPSACVLLYNDVDRESWIVNREENSVSSNTSPSTSHDPRITSLARLSILRETEDGFRIAEEDLKLRGGGDILGTRQSGLPRFIFADLFNHRDLLEQARKDVRQFLNRDPDFTSPRGQALKLLLELFGFEVST